MSETSFLLNHSFIGDKIRKNIKKNYDYDRTPHFLRNLDGDISYIDESLPTLTDTNSKQESPYVYQKKVDFKNSIYIMKVKDFQK